MPRDIDDTPMPLGQHLDELRRRLLLAIVGVAPVFVVGLVFGKEILHFIITPLVTALKRHRLFEGSMQATNVLEGFMTYLKIAALLAVIVGAPWILYQLWRFVAPGLYSREKRFAYLLAPMSLLLSLTGLAFMYYLMLPFALLFFVHFNATLLSQPPTPTVEVPAGVVLPSVPQFAGDPKGAAPGQMWLNTERGALRIAVPARPAPKVTLRTLLGLAEAPETPPAGPAPDAAAAGPVEVLSLPLHSDSFVAQHYKLAEYVQLVLTFSVVFAVVFQTPVVVLLLGWAGILDPGIMRKYRRHVILVIAVIAGVTTPPDPISMMAMAVPMYLLFELGLLLLRALPARRVSEGYVKARRHAGPVDPGDDSDAA